MKTYRRLTLRLTAFNIAISAVILVIVLFIALSLVQEQIAERNQGIFRDTLQSLVAQVSADSIIPQSYLADMEKNNDLAVYIEDNHEPLFWPGVWKFGGKRDMLMQKVLEQARALGYDADAPPMRSGGVDFILWDAGTSYRAAVHIFVHGQNALTIAILQNGAAEQAMFLRVFLIFIVTILGSLLLFALSSYFFVRRALRPVQLAQMQQTEFVQAASHELRTPLAVISATASALPRADAQRRARFIETINRETIYMGRLIDDMLLLASSDRSANAPSDMPVEIQDIMQQAAEKMQTLAQEKHLTIAVSLPPRMPIIPGDEHALLQLLRILLDNAIEYSPEGGVIELRAQLTPHHTIIEVADEGPGIPDEYKQDVFRRFYRLDKARAREKNHYGLGLSIAWEIVQRHKGQIYITDNQPQGAIFSVRLRHLR